MVDEAAVAPAQVGRGGRVLQEPRAWQRAVRHSYDKTLKVFSDKNASRSVLFDL